MAIRIDIGTDIATIGVWDPMRERHDLKTAKFADFEAGIQSEAENAKLFFINTGADGSYLTDVYVDEEPSVELLSVYVAVTREFLISSESGRLVASGVEDFVSDSKQISSDKDHFRVTPGLYALKVYQRDEDKLTARLRDHLGAEDYGYYERKYSGTPWGFILFVLAAAASMLSRQWLLVAVLFIVWVIYSVIRPCITAVDKRFRDIANRVEEFDTRFPPFIYVLRSVPEAGGIRGGWYELN